MNQRDARVTHASVVLAAASGFWYGWLLYFGGREDDFGPVQHGWVPALHTAHVVTVPLFVFALGMLWNHHIVAKLRSRQEPRRRTGTLLLSQALPMIATGYLLQISVDEVWRATWTWAHGISSCLFTLLFLLHLIARPTPDPASRTAGHG